jgi:MSHA biogenesis protein MshO
MTLLSQNRQAQQKNKTNNKIVNQAGFTLIELVIVIVILGILAVGVSSFLKFGAQIFVDATDRDKILSSARFAIERLNRELRGALPNSARVLSDGCLEFTPIAYSFVYIDIPVAPEAANDTITLVPSGSTFTLAAEDNYSVVVYPLSNDDVYKSDKNKVYSLMSANFSITPYQLTLTSPIHFAEESTTQRIFIMKRAVMYCYENNNELVRYNIDGHTADGSFTTRSNRALMAENLSAVTFKAGTVTRQRNGTVEVNFEFSRNSEIIRFNNEVQVPNVP